MDDAVHLHLPQVRGEPERDFIRYMGTYLAVWAAPNYLGLDRWQIFHQVPGGSWGGGVMTVRDNTELRVYMGFESEEPLAYDYRDAEVQKQIMLKEFEGVKRELPRLLEHVKAAEIFHFDAMAQIHMGSWSKGRVVLLGDAGYRGSPLSGQGTSMAMVGAYVLAGELKAADGDHEMAFGAYEAEVRDYVTANQELAFTNKARVEAQHATEMGEQESAEGMAEVDYQDFGDVVNSVRLKQY